MAKTNEKWGVDNGTEKGTGFFLLQHRLMRSAPDEPAVHRRKYYLQPSSVPGADLRYGRTADGVQDRGDAVRIKTSSNAKDQ